MQQLIITTIPEYPDKIFSLQAKDQKICQIDVLSKDNAQLIGNIYIGKIKNIAENIEAAFVEIEGGQLCFVPFSELKTPIYTNRNDKWKGIPAGNGSPKPRPGDELLVQISKEALKTKLPGATSKISITGTYLVLTSGNCKLGISGKLSNNEKDRLKDGLLDIVTDEYGFILRTNAENTDLAIIHREAELLKEQYRLVKQKALSRNCFACIYKTDSELTTALRNIRHEYFDEIVTDITDFIVPDEVDVPLRIYKDEQLPLYKLYSVESVIKEALQERIWLKSGGYLVIQPTEALTVIDVNTGKFEGRKKPEETFRKINKEAAIEAARQLRLRNISGIILIDFIDMKNPDHIQELTSIFKRELKNDPVKTDFVDFTKLGLAEVTRKKVKKSLKEQLL